MDKKRRIYTLTGLPPEVVAVAFAKCSRSPEPFDKIAAELNADKSRKFHEKWVVGYGHSSVAEHAVLSIALENVSMLATKVLEDNRLASYTEKSTRYQVFDKTTYLKPKKIMESKFKDLYEQTTDFIMDQYTQLVPKMTNFFKAKFPDKAEIEIKNLALDACRYLLPVSTLTNLGMTLNARNLEHGIIKLLTHPFNEMNEIGNELKESALKVTPTLIKHIKYNEYLGETDKALKQSLKSTQQPNNKTNQNEVTLVEFDNDAEIKLLSSLIYKYSQLNYNQAKEKVLALSNEEKENIINESLKRLGKFDAPLRKLEHIFYTFDVLIDYGAFRDVQRHRMCTQTNQDFTVDQGYIIPDEIIEAGFKNIYVECMEKAEQAYKQIKPELDEASYIIPMAFRKRVLMKMNLRSLFHFIKLRSGKTGHLSYRQVAWQMYDLIKEQHPLLAKYIQVEKD